MYQRNSPSELNGIFSVLTSVVKGAGSVAAGVVRALPDLANTYASIQNVNLQRAQLKAQMAAQSPPAVTPVSQPPLLPNQPIPGTPGTVQNPTFIQPTPVATAGNNLIPAIEVGGANITPLLLVASVALLAVLTARKN